MPLLSCSHPLLQESFLTFTDSNTYPRSHHHGGRTPCSPPCTSSGNGGRKKKTVIQDYMLHCTYIFLDCGIHCMWLQCHWSADHTHTGCFKGYCIHMPLIKTSVPVTMATEVLHQQGKFYANRGKSQQDIVAFNSYW